MEKQELRKEFDIEYQIADIPFKDLFENNKLFLDYLFEDFLKCERAPSLRMFKRQYISEEEEDQIIEEADKLIPECSNSFIAATYPKTEGEKVLLRIYEDFNLSKCNNRISDELYLPDIKKCNTVQTLSRVQDIISDTQIYLSRPMTEPDMSHFIERQCMVINNLLDKLGCNNLKDAILDAIINEDTTLFIAASISVGTEEFVSGQRADNIKWRIAKNQMMSVLEGYKMKCLQEKEELPEALQTERAKEIFDKAINAGFVKNDGNLYQWKGQKNELAAFIDCSSSALGIRPSNGRVPWVLYRQAFNLSEKEIAAARDAKKDYDMDRRAKPEKWALICSICNQ